MHKTRMSKKSKVLLDIKTDPCPKCNESSIMTVSVFGYKLWQSGAFIQNAFPLMTAAERETLLSGFHSKCFDETFPPDEDEESVSEQVNNYWAEQHEDNA